MAWRNQCIVRRPPPQIRWLTALLLLPLVDCFATQANAQAPGLAWSTNLGAQVFALDAQTNLYANSGGTVFLLSANGVPLQTNTICPLSGVARRDVAGNFYFAGIFDGTQNFGGMTIVGGWINHGQYTPGWPTCFLAKYASNGSLQWATSFGMQAQVNTLRDLAVDPGGGCYAGHATEPNGALVTHLSDPGTVDWTWLQPNTGSSGNWVKLGGATTSNCCELTIQTSPIPYAKLTQISRTGSASSFGAFPLLWRTTASSYAQPVIDDLARPFQVGCCFNIFTGNCNTQLVRKCIVGAEIYRVEVTTNAEYTLGRDATGAIYVGGGNGMLAKYSDTADLIWSNNFVQPCLRMVIDPSGKRFISLADGTVARLQDDATPQPVQINSSPAPQTVFVGDSVTLAVSAVGTPPIFYAWLRNGTNLPGATSSNLTLNPLLASDTGQYSIVVNNNLNAVTSAPALLRVKSVQLYWGSQMLTNGAYVFGSPPTLTIRSAFTNGSRFYTLDGSAPTQTSTPCAGQFVLEHNATVRAIGYNSNGSQSEEADQITATVYSQHTLTVTISGGGSVLLNPPGGTYPNTQTVTATAVSAPGCAFLYWLDDASGSSPSVQLSMEYDRSIVAVFGTNLPSGIAPPGLVWKTNLGARLFSVDAQTNLYANAGGTVFLLNASGVPLQTNTICPISGLARRDASGYYYFAGSFDGTQDFGGLTIVGGWTNNSGHYSPGWPTCFLAKYASNGSLQWATSFGVQAQQNTLTDLAIDPAGGCYAGYDTSYDGARVTHLSDSGTSDWSWTQPNTGPYVNWVRLGGTTTSNCCELTLETGSPQYAKVTQLSRTGGASSFGTYPLTWRTIPPTNAQPVIDDSGNLFQVGECFTPLDANCPAQWLRKCVSGTDLWEREIPPDAEWTLARDLGGNVHVAGNNGMLAEYGDGGDMIWSNNFAQPSMAMVVDTSANRFVSFADGAIARLGPDVAGPSAFGIAGDGSTAGGPRFFLKGKPSQAWQIQVSTNLSTWSTLCTITNASGSFQFNDPSPRMYRARFYRAFPLP